jgi:hypothetical protein
VRSRLGKWQIDYISKVRILPLRDTEELADWEHRRPVRWWWMQLHPIIDVLSGRLAAARAPML